MNLVEVIRREVGGYAGNAVDEKGLKLSYPALFLEVERLGAELARFGVGPECRVGVEVDNSAGYIALSLAILSLDAVIVPISVSASPEEVREIVERIELNFLAAVRLPEALEGRRVGTVGCLNGLSVALAAFREVPVRALELGEGRRAAFIRFSSGTTGASKGVVLSHRAVVERTAACTRLRIGEGEAVLWVLDMAYHFVVTIILFLRRRAEIVLADTMDVSSMARAVSANPVRLLYATPYHYRVMTSSELFAPESLSGVRQAISTAMRLTAAEAAAFESKFHLPLAQAYGIIEVGLPCLNECVAGARVDSVGQLQEAYRLRLDSPDADGVGEIVLSGPGMFDAYCWPFTLRTELEPDGAFRTGDLGRVDADGYVFIVGRAKNVINFLGMKVFPYEVESVLDAHPAVAESRVSGFPLAGYGEIPAAELVLKPGRRLDEALIADLRSFCFGRLASFKVPKEFCQVEKLERTLSGKLVRKK